MVTEASPVMNRRAFLKNCACGVCTCSTAGLLSPAAAAADTKTSDDWRLPFVQARFAKLLELLPARLDEAAIAELLRDLGRFCGSSSRMVQEHRGRIDDFIRVFGEKYAETITFDRENGIITVVGPERDSCFCPLVDHRICPQSVCSCSLGWQQQVYETLLGRKVEVTLRESVVRGGRRCAFEVRLQGPMQS